VMAMAMTVLKLPVTMVTMWKAIVIAILKETHGVIDTESDGSSFKLSKEDEAFRETACGSRLDYKSRKPKMAKYGVPDTKWTICPSLPPVVEATLPKDAVKEDKVAFRTQEMYMEAMVPTPRPS